MLLMDRSIQPELSSVELSDIRKPDVRVMRNGMNLACFDVPGSEMVRADFLFRAGQWEQSRPLQAKFSFSHLKEGTHSFSADEIAEKLDFYGVSVDFVSTMYYSLATVYCLKKSFKKILPILQSIFTEPVYEEDKLSLELSTAKQSFLISSQTVNFQCRNLFYKTLYGCGHPVTMQPEEKDFATLNREDLLEFKNKYIGSDNCKIYLTGGLDDDIITSVESLFGESAWGCNSKETVLLKPHDIVSAEEKRSVVKMSGTFQSAVRMGCLFPPRDSDDFVPLTMLSTILGGYFGSRLMTNIRETKGYTYDISTVISTVPYNSAFMVVTETANDYVERVIEEVYLEMEKLKREPVGDAELAQVKNYMTGYACRNNDGGFQLPNAFVILDILGKSPETLLENNRRIRNMSADVIMEYAQKYLNAENMKECIVGDVH